MKRVHLIPLIILSIIFCCSSPPSERTMMNERNIGKVKVGMKLNQVQDIMGVPDQILIYPFNDKEFDVVYIAPPKYDDDFHVYVLRQDSTVLRVVSGE